MILPLLSLLYWLGGKDDQGSVIQEGREKPGNRSLFIPVEEQSAGELYIYAVDSVGVTSAEIKIQQSE